MVVDLLILIAGITTEVLIPTSATNFVYPIGNVTVTVGREATLSCIIDDVGNNMIAWIHVDRQMVLTVHNRVVTKISRFFLKDQDNGRVWSLHIKNVQEVDRGTYMCQVNTEPVIKQEGYLEVLVPPIINDEESSTSVQCILEHSDIVLQCKAKGYPSPYITWFRENSNSLMKEEQKSANNFYGNSLFLQRVTRHEMGAYLCVATNGVPPSVSKRITLEVEFSPQIYMENQVLGLPAGANASLVCFSEAYPKAIVFWKFKDSLILSNKKYQSKETAKGYLLQLALTIINITKSDYGQYYCISKNSVGEAVGTVRVYEIPMPVYKSKWNHDKNEHVTSNGENKGLICCLIICVIHAVLISLGSN